MRGSAKYRVSLLIERKDGLGPRGDIAFRVITNEVLKFAFETVAVAFHGLGERT